MPELPEVETTLRGLQPFLLGARVTAVKVRNPNLRWPVPENLGRRLPGREITCLRRRGKYLLLDIAGGCVLIHLGMSGSLRIADATEPATRHDHVDILLAGGHILRFRDPRRFGCVLWHDGDGETHPLLIHAGPEPLSDSFNGLWLHHASKGRKTAVKNFIMDARVVVGVGNIYASEALFRSGIHPRRNAARIAIPRYIRLAACIKEVLREAIKAGGTTLRDFYNGRGEPGYFRTALDVYDRAGQPCTHCGGTVRRQVIGQRSSYYCPRCQR